MHLLRHVMEAHYSGLARDYAAQACLLTAQGKTASAQAWQRNWHLARSLSPHMFTMHTASLRAASERSSRNTNLLIEALKSSGILALIAILLALIPFMTFKYGPALRARSKAAQRDEEEAEKQGEDEDEEARVERRKTRRRSRRMSISY
jgi:hypothetical protein